MWCQSEIQHGSHLIELKILCKESLNSGDQQFLQYQQRKNYFKPQIHEKKGTYADGNEGPSSEQAQKYGWVKPVNAL